MKLNEKNLMLVKWFDSQRDDDEWVHLDDINIESPLCISMGWIIKEDDNKVILCQDFLHSVGSKDATQLFVIPRVSIDDVFYMKKCKDQTKYVMIDWLDSFTINETIDIQAPVDIPLSYRRSAGRIGKNKEGFTHVCPNMFEDKKIVCNGHQIMNDVIESISYFKLDRGALCF